MTASGTSPFIPSEFNETMRCTAQSVPQSRSVVFAEFVLLQQMVPVAVQTRRDDGQRLKRFNGSTSSNDEEHYDRLEPLNLSALIDSKTTI